MFRNWVQGTLQSILATIIIAAVPGFIVARLSRIQSEWTTPILLGLCAWALGMVILVALNAIRTLPPRRMIPTLKNIELCVRTWLDNFHIAVQNSPIPTTYFRYLVTVASGTKMLVGRTKEGFDEYVQIRSEVAPDKDDLRRISELTEKEQLTLILKIRLELARRNVGYSNLRFPANDFYISKRIPIRESLTEHEFIAAIDEVEAAVHSVGIVFGLALVDADKSPEQFLALLKAEN